MRRLLVLALCALPAFAQKDSVSRSWNQPVEPFRIIGNVYYVGASDITSFLITTPKGHIVIDGGFEETAPMIERNIETLGFKVMDVRILLSSHAHYDHAGGLAELKRVTGAKLMAGAGDVAQLARGGLDDSQFGNRFPFPPVEVDRALRDGDRITLGGVTVVARATPGHTRGCTTYTMRVRGRDVVFIGSPSVPSEYKLTESLIADYRAQFALLESLPCDVFLAAHGNFFHLAEKIKTRAFVDPEGYKKFVAAMKAAFEKRAAQS